MYVFFIVIVMKDKQMQSSELIIQQFQQPQYPAKMHIPTLPQATA